MAERFLAMEEVEGSIPFSHSRRFQIEIGLGVGPDLPKVVRGVRISYLAPFVQEYLSWQRAVLPSRMSRVRTPSLAPTF